MKVTPEARKREAVRRDLESKGISIVEFARLHKLNRHVVTDVLLGRTKGRYGKAHKAAVALGLKPDPAATKTKTGDQ